MQIDNLLKLINQAVDGQKMQAAMNAGHWSLGRLRDELGKFPGDMPCQYDTGHNFGLSPVNYIDEDADKYSGEYCWAESESAYPSTYRGYYSDCTFNAEKSFEVSTVTHVISLVNGAIGRTFCGYKGGEYPFNEGTLIWGGSTSMSSTGNNERVVGVEVINGTLIIKTEIEKCN